MAADSELHRALGQVEGKLDGIVATLTRVDERSAARDETLAAVLERLDKMERKGQHHDDVAAAFAALQQTLRDGRMQARGVVIGIGLAAGAGGATIAAFFKGVYAWLAGGAP